MLRRKLHTNTLAGHWLDVLLLTPVCLWLALRVLPQGISGWSAIQGEPALHLLVPLLGVLSAVALALYMAASRLLPLGLFGLLSYVEPLLLVVAALLMGERVAAGAGGRAAGAPPARRGRHCGLNGLKNRCNALLDCADSYGFCAESAGAEAAKLSAHFCASACR